ncbi:MAG: phage recombination protein Bet [Candidatus Eremiobacteraeota bacterium]|nr:phage recombination protein Bet [Candidatus Eremiobacteraeota bacterium]
MKHTVAIGATDMELALFLQTAKHRGLDVFARQIHFVKRRQKRGDKWVEVGTMQTGIDGFRLIADRTGKYDGQDEVEFEYIDPARRAIPHRATVRVYRKDMSRPVSGTAYWAEYADTYDDGNPRGMWKKMPHLMLAKTAEALALRKAFPENLSGLYTEDEMPAIDVDATVRDGAGAPPTGTVTKIADRAQRDSTSTPIVDEIPPADADATALRAWLGKRLAFRTKSWTAEHMALACGEVARALGLSEDEVIPKTLASHLVAYRNAIAEGAGVAQDVAEPIPTTIEPPAADERVAGARNAIIELLMEHGIANNDERLQEACGHITADSEAGVRYAWESRDEAEMARLLAGLQLFASTGEMDVTP